MRLVDKAHSPCWLCVEPILWLLHAQGYQVFPAKRTQRGG
jgi:hypothetical protein